MKYSVLEDRILLYNGQSLVEPEIINSLLLSGIHPNYILTSELTEDIELFNMLSDDIIKQYKEEDIHFDFNWNIPKKYLDIDLIDYFSEYITKDNSNRISEELQIVIDNNLQNHFKCMIYIVDMFKSKKQIWGIGRGSSVACYLLYLIGIHNIDCIKFNIPYTEFFH
jgi:DNA polymerase III alpha subunit